MSTSMSSTSSTSILPQTFGSLLSSSMNEFDASTPPSHHTPSHHISIAPSGQWSEEAFMKSAPSVPWYVSQSETKRSSTESQKSSLVVFTEDKWNSMSFEQKFDELHWEWVSDRFPNIEWSVLEPFVKVFDDRFEKEQAEAAISKVKEILVGDKKLLGVIKEICSISKRIICNQCLNNRDRKIKTDRYSDVYGILQPIEHKCELTTEYLTGDDHQTYDNDIINRHLGKVCIIRREDKDGISLMREGDSGNRGHDHSWITTKGSCGNPLYIRNARNTVFESRNTVFESNGKIKSRDILENKEVFVSTCGSGIIDYKDEYEYVDPITVLKSEGGWTQTSVTIPMKVLDELVGGM